MIIRKSSAEWRGDLKSGAGDIALGSGAYNGPYSFQSRFESGTGTNPEELIAAAHAGCFSMAFSHALTQAGFTAASVRTNAAVKLEPAPGGFAITGIHLEMTASIPGIAEAQFQEIAAAAKVGCPVSKALAAVPITLAATLAA
jgi:osmotically inducible protein OsmC